MFILVCNLTLQRKKTNDVQLQYCLQHICQTGCITCISCNNMYMHLEKKTNWFCISKSGQIDLGLSTLYMVHNKSEVNASANVRFLKYSQKHSSYTRKYVCLCSTTRTIDLVISFPSEFHLLDFFIYSRNKINWYNLKKFHQPTDIHLPAITILFSFLNNGIHYILINHLISSGTQQTALV